MKKPVRSVVVGALMGMTLAGCANPFDYGEAGSGQSDAPTLGEMRDQLTASWDERESVTVTGDVLAGEQDLDEFFEGVGPQDRGVLRISGQFDGTNSALSFEAGDDEFTQIAIEGNEYFQGESFAEVLISELDDEIGESLTEESIREVIGHNWVQFNDDGAGGVFSAQQLLSSWEVELPAEMNSVTAATETRDGSDVWVYRAGESQDELLVVTAEENPEVLGITSGGSEYTFSEWDTSQAPEVPPESLTVDEIFEAISAQQGWDASAPEITVSS